MTYPIRPEFELVLDFMPLLITSQFDEDPIRNERARLEKPFSHYKSIEFFRRSRAPNLDVSGPIWPKVDHFRCFMPVLVTCKFDEDRIKTEGVNVETSVSSL